MTRMLFHTYDASTGEITGSYSLSQAKASDIDLNTKSGEAWVVVAQHGRSDTHYIDLTDPQNPVVADRPVWNPFPATGAAPLVVDITDAPSGTSILLTNEAGEELTVDQSQGPINLTDTGVYRVQINPPWPYQGAQTEVTVT